MPLVVETKGKTGLSEAQQKEHKCLTCEHGIKQIQAKPAGSGWAASLVISCPETMNLIFSGNAVLECEIYHADKAEKARIRREYDENVVLSAQADIEQDAHVGDS
jgi:hypothetical protein